MDLEPAAPLERRDITTVDGNDPRFVTGAGERLRLAQDPRVHGAVVCDEDADTHY